MMNVIDRYFPLILAITVLVLLFGIVFIGGYYVRKHSKHRHCGSFDDYLYEEPRRHSPNRETDSDFDSDESMTTRMFSDPYDTHLESYVFDDSELDKDGDGYEDDTVGDERF